MGIAHIILTNNFCIQLFWSKSELFSELKVDQIFNINMRENEI